MSNSPTRHTHHPLIELTLVRIREFMRQTEAVFWVFGFPIILTLALGIAFRNTGPEKILVGVEDNGRPAAQVVDSLKSAPDMKVSLSSAEQATKDLRAGKVTLVVIAVDDGSYSYRFDPTRPESRVARLAVDDLLQRKRGRSDPAAVREQKVTESGSRYIDFMLPGLLGLNMMGSAMWGLCFGVVDMRSKKLLKRLAATPMRRSHFLLSIMISRLVGLVAELAVVLGFARYVFDVQVRGSLFAVLVISIIGSLSFSALATLLSARATTIEAVSGWMNLVMVPMWLFSGTFFSSARFPDFSQPFIKALPLTALNDALRSVITDGAGLSANGLEISILVAWAILSFAVALRLFRWQ